MMGGSLIWPQNSNRVAFGSLFGKTRLENWLTQYFVNFRVFFVKKVVKCYDIRILRPDLESSHHFTYFRSLLVIISTFSQFRNKRPKRHNNSWCGDRLAEKMVISTWPDDLLGIFWGGGGMTCPPPQKKF